MWDKIKNAFKVIIGIIAGIATVAGTVLLIIFGIKKQEIKETNKKINKLEEENKKDNEKIDNNNYNDYDDRGRIK